MGITLAIFQISGNIPSSKDLFIKIHKGFETDLETHLSILWLRLDGEERAGCFA